MVFDACCLSQEEAEQKARSRKIDRQIAQEKVQYRRQVKILLLGAGESGKSTFLKQMRIIHGKDFDSDALNEFRPIIYGNILKGMKVLADARRKLRLEWQNPSNQQYAEIILNFQAPQHIDTDMFLGYFDCVKRLWRDKGIQDAYDRRREFQLVSHCVKLLELGYGGKITTCKSCITTRKERLLQRATANKVLLIQHAIFADFRKCWFLKNIIVFLSGTCPLCISCSLVCLLNRDVVHDRMKLSD